MSGPNVVLTPGNQGIQALRPDSANDQKVALGASSAQCTALPEGCRVVQLCASGACHVAVGVDPTADATSMYLPADAVVTIAVNAHNANHAADLIAVIRDGSATGNLHITPLF